MQESTDKHTLSRKRRRQNGLLPLVLVLAAIGAGTVAYYQFFTPAAESQLEIASVSMDEEHTGSHAAPTDQAASFNLSPDQSTAAPGEDGAAADGTMGIDESAAPSPHTQAEQALPAAQGLAPPDIQAARQRLEQFYGMLDSRPFIADARLGMPSREYLALLIQKMLDTPPLVSGETADLFNVLRNSAHFFRIAGKDNLALLKTIMVSDRQFHEQLLADCYFLSQEPEQLRLASGVSVNDENLYEYAGFFLTTMGGRLYLSRRDPGLRMLVSYYSILLVDKANTDGRNRHGIDLGPPVAQLIAEMETSGGQLLGRDNYLDTLYRLQGKYPPGR